MAYSLLHPQAGTSHATQLDSKILYHLSFDRSVSRISADVKKQKSFLSVISMLTDDVAEIEYRREIIRDFRENPKLFSDFVSLCKRFDDLHLSAKNAGKDDFRLVVTQDVSFDSAKNILRTNALLLKRALLFVKAFGELLCSYSLRSQALTQLLSELKGIYESSNYEKLLLTCTKYESLSTIGFLDFRFEINEFGKLTSYELVDHRHIRITDPDLKRKGFSLFKKETETYPCARIHPEKNDFYGKLAVGAVADLSNLLRKLAAQLFDRFAIPSRELDFYDVSLRYIEMLSQKGMFLCNPHFSKDGAAEGKGLYDLYLLLTKSNAAEVIPNDFAMRNSGLLVFGDNGSGKTVYLRSIATMQLLAQAGLPVPCSSATIPCFSQIATQFSEAEKEFVSGNDAGRFEQEVRELAAMVDTLREGALVLLNETFQSTAYKESADGLYHLLNYFSAKNIKWILVTHLTDLKRYFDDQAMIAEMKEYHFF